jgi:thiosulfate/3-mercaptopyruvate sulfurtransferase
MSDHGSTMISASIPSRIQSLVVVLATFTLAAAVAAQSPAPTRDSLLVTPDWLAARLSDPNLVLFHVGDGAEYAKQHLPGARLVALYDLSLRTSDGLRLEMMPEPELRAKLSALGVSDSSRVVLYCDSPAGITQITRLMFTLDRAGLGSRSSILDGGLAAWTGAGHQVTTEVPTATAGQLSTLTIRPMVVTGDTVRSRLDTPGFKVIDGRATSFYDGTQTGGTAEARHKTGHITGAGSVPFSSVVDGLQWRTPAELRALFDKAGVKPGDTIIAYCHIGQQATAAIFAARTLGHPVLLYDGSFEDWSKRADGPVTVK